jgi:hypothetical protein
MVAHIHIPAVPVVCVDAGVWCQQVKGGYKHTKVSAGSRGNGACMLPESTLSCGAPCGAQSWRVLLGYVYQNTPS